jgi:hypothetical protein
VAIKHITPSKIMETPHVTLPVAALAISGMAMMMLLLWTANAKSDQQVAPSLVQMVVLYNDLSSSCGTIKARQKDSHVTSSKHTSMAST